MNFKTAIYLLEYLGVKFQLLNPSIRKKLLIFPTINVSCNPVDNMTKSCYYSDVIFMDAYVYFYEAKQRAEKLKKRFEDDIIH